MDLCSALQFSGIYVTKAASSLTISTIRDIIEQPLYWSLLLIVKQSLLLV